MHKRFSIAFLSALLITGTFCGCGGDKTKETPEIVTEQEANAASEDASFSDAEDETEESDSSENLPEGGDMTVEEADAEVKLDPPDMVVTQSSVSSGVSINTSGQAQVSQLNEYTETVPKGDVVAESKIMVASIGSYDGPYLEDGSDDPVRGVLSIVVTNISNEFLQFSQITLSNGSGEATFELSNLPAGASALVLEKNRTPAGGDWAYVDDVSAFLEQAPSYGELFSWEAGDHFLQLHNNSSENFNHIYVYYKNTENGMYVGGITYRMAFDGMAAGQSGQKLSAHFDGNNSHVMMIDYIK